MPIRTSYDASFTPAELRVLAHALEAHQRTLQAVLEVHPFHSIARERDIAQDILGGVQMMLEQAGTADLEAAFGKAD